MTARPGTRRTMTERRRTNEVYQQPLGKDDAAEAPPPGSGPGKAAQGLPVFRVSLLARDRLRVLLPGAYAGPGWREVTAWPVN